MRKRKYIYCLIYLLILIAITGCSSAISVKANADNTARIQFSLETGKTVKGLLDSYGVSFSDGVLEQMKKSFEEYNFKNVRVSSKSLSSLSIQGTTDQKDSNGAITISKTGLSLTLSPATMQSLAQSLPEESRYYLDLFAAPIFTGEVMSQEEYIDLIAVIYGNDIAQELKNAVLKITLESPGSRKEHFQIPVVEFFTLTSEKVFCINY